MQSVSVREILALLSSVQRVCDDADEFVGHLPIAIATLVGAKNYWKILAVDGGEQSFGWAVIAIDGARPLQAFPTEIAELRSSVGS